MLAYVFWHRAAAGVEQAAYEQAVEHFHRSFAHRPPSGFRGSAALRLPDLPWLEPLAGAEQAPGYEDWYLIEDWSAAGVLEEAAVSRGHLTAHDAAAARAGAAAGAIYRLVEGCPRLDAGYAVWVKHKSGHEPPSLGALLGDGMAPERDGLWRRCMVLGPAPEHCLLAGEPTAGAAPGRLPAGWSARTLAREAIWSG
ncbi:MAG TPA: hypothetical protein VLJ80_09180 [Solirubrobacteraceae bacterium]|nr:hypothetical protein [Solirubrobacteraceae bacterium]